MMLEHTKWINGYLHIDIPNGIDNEQYAEIRNFLILWNLFEGRLFNFDFKKNKIDSTIYPLRMNQDVINDIFTHYKNRYVINGEINSKFEKLRFRQNDYKVFVINTLLGQQDNINDIKKAITMIVYRLRNNLFHGEKEIATAYRQDDNFIIANKFLIECLESCKKSRNIE